MNETLDEVLDETPPIDGEALAAEKPPSLRESLSAAYDEHLVPNEGEKPLAELPPVVEAKPLGEAPPAAAAAEAPPDTIPERLKGKLGEKWATMPPEVKAEFREYESAIGRMADKYGKAAKNWTESERVFAPYAEMVRSEGGNFHSAIGNLFETARLLRQGSPEQKQGLLVAMAQAYNIPMPGAPAQPGQSAPTNVAQLSPELLHRINVLEQERLTARATADHNVRAQIDNDLNAFVADSQNGYVKEVGFLDTMAALIQAGKAEGLSDAYKQAAWLHEGPRNAEIAKITAERNAPRVAAAQRARAAGVSVNGNAPGTVRLDPSKMSLRETLAAAYDGELDPN